MAADHTLGTRRRRGGILALFTLLPPCLFLATAAPAVASGEPAPTPDGARAPRSIPEPGTLLLVGGGVFVLLGVQRFRRGSH